MLERVAALHRGLQVTYMLYIYMLQCLWMQESIRQACARETWNSHKTVCKQTACMYYIHVVRYTCHLSTCPTHTTCTGILRMPLAQFVMLTFTGLDLGPCSLRCSPPTLIGVIGYLDIHRGSHNNFAMMTTTIKPMPPPGFGNNKSKPNPWHRVMPYIASHQAASQTPASCTYAFKCLWKQGQRGCVGRIVACIMWG